MFIIRRSAAYILPLCALSILGSGCLLKTNADAEGRDVISSSDMDQGVVTLPPEDMESDGDMSAPSDMPTPPSDMASGPCGADEQDNDGDGTCMPTCEASGINCTGMGVCSDAMGEASCTQTPASCEQVRSLALTQDDGFYTLYAQNDPQKPWRAICVDMNTPTPGTYLPLGVNSGSSNRFEYVDIRETSSGSGNFEAVTMAVTTFWMVRVDPLTLRVDLEDFTFSSTEYYDVEIENSGKRVPFGTAESCSKQIQDALQWQDASSVIDLTHTPFKIADRFVTAGECAEPFDAEVDGVVQEVEINGGSPTASECAMVGPESYAARQGSQCEGGNVVEGQAGVEPFMQLAYVGSSTDPSEVPRTCLELKFADFSREDGDYTLYADRDPGKPWNATCEGLTAMTEKRFLKTGRAAGPKEYLELVEVTGESNLMQEGGDDTNPVRKETRYTKLRIDPRTFEVNVVDDSYAETTLIEQDLNDQSSVKYGIVSSRSQFCCNGNYPGKGVIDLTGTGFQVDDTFLLYGECPVGGATPPQGGAKVTLLGDGSPGTIGPRRAALPTIRSCNEVFVEGSHYSELNFILRLSYP